MADISMCFGQTTKVDCERKQDCYRYTAQPSQRQSYFGVPVVVIDGVQCCEEYWPNKPPKKNKE